MTDKKSARKEILARLNSLSPEEIVRLSELMQARVLEMDEFRTAKRPFVYLGMEHEAQTIRLITALHAQGAQVFAPRCHAGGKMDAILLSGAPLRRSHMGFLEPEGESIAPGEIDLVLTPLLAFDENCHRLGRGGGFYDRFLAQTRCPRIGLALEVQKIPVVPCDAWDEPLDKIVTEKSVYVKQEVDA